MNAGSTKKVTIACQGGGAHGAFTWGVLDKLLEDGRLEIEGLTGTSSGAMNAVAVAQGLATHNPEKARELLKTFWHGVSESGKYNIFNSRGPMDKATKNFNEHHSPGFVWYDMLTHIFTPSELNSIQIDPLKDVIIKTFDFELIRKQQVCKVFVCATHVRTGRLKIFKTHELCHECMSATVCLPTLHSPVLVDGEYYWDGGFIGNPVFFPLIYDCKTPDIILIQINPVIKNALPTSASEIADRLNEITNNTAVIREMRSISFIQELIEKGIVKENALKKVYMHVIEDEAAFQTLGWASKVNTEWEFLTSLYEKGRVAAANWLQNNFDMLGKQTTAPIKEHYVGDAW